MEKSEFFTMLGERQGITLDQASSEWMVRSGGVYEMLSGMKTILFGMDVSAYRPLDAPVFDPEGGAK